MPSQNIYFFYLFIFIKKKILYFNHFYVLLERSILFRGKKIHRMVSCIAKRIIIIMYYYYIMCIEIEELNIKKQWVCHCITFILAENSIQFLLQLYFVEFFVRFVMIRYTIQFVCVSKSFFLNRTIRIPSTWYFVCDRRSWFIQSTLFTYIHIYTHTNKHIRGVSDVRWCIDTLCTENRRFEFIFLHSSFHF